MVLRYTYTYIYHYYDLDIPGPTRESFVLDSRRALRDQCRLGLELNPASGVCVGSGLFRSRDSSVFILEMTLNR